MGNSLRTALSWVRDGPALRGEGLLLAESMLLRLPLRPRWLSCWLPLLLLLVGLFALLAAAAVAATGRSPAAAVDVSASAAAGVAACRLPVAAR